LPTRFNGESSGGSSRENSKNPVGFPISVIVDR
jgi:hypothetical protein